jgi:hypothetical protein
MVLGISLNGEFDMKLANKPFVILLLGLLLTVAACGQTEIKPENKEIKSGNVKAKDQITETIGENKLTLQNNDGKCRLLFGEQKIDLDIPWQCNFHRLPEGKVRVFPRDFYKAKSKKTPKEYKNVQIILIEYSKPDENNPKDCRTEIQAIKISKGKITKSTKMGNLAVCPPFQWDDINFIGLF